MTDERHGGFLTAAEIAGACGVCETTARKRLSSVDWVEKKDDIRRVRLGARGLCVKRPVKLYRFTEEVERLVSGEGV